ncbi:MAG: PAS domain S-box protein [Syntrophobacteraceae bacterium]|nr:PAS domain S-box protein [Desulfobacteraceae bacterium]
MRNPSGKTFSNLKTALKDLLILSGTAIVVLGLALYFDAFDKFTHWYVKQEEPYELEELLVVIFALSIGFAIFSYRRWKELTREVAERERIEKALIEQSDSLRILLDTLPNPVFYKDEEGKCTGCNKAFEVFTGKPRETILGKETHRVWPAFQSAAPNGPEGGENVQEMPFRELTMENGKGEPRHLLLHQAAIPDARGRPAGSIGILTDVTELKRAEISLTEEAVRRRILFEQSRDGIVVLDQEGAVYEANQKYADMLGYSFDELRSLHVWDWDARWDREELLEQIRLVGPAGDHFETHHRRKDGSVFDVEISTNGAVFGDQKLVFCVCRDISERKAAESALREREEIYSAIVNQAADSIVLVDSETLGFIEFNDAASTGLGYTREEFSGLTLFDLQATMPREELEGYIRSAIENGCVHFENRQRLKDGSPRDVHISKRAIRIRGRDYLATIWHDITRQKESEQALQASEARLQLAMSASHLGVWEWDIQTNVVYCSPQCCEIFEIEQSEASIESFQRQVHPEDLTTIKTAFDNALSCGTVHSSEYRIVRRNGELIWVYSLGRAFFDEAGKPLRVAGIVQDITAGKKAQEEKQKLEAQLFQAQKMESIGRLAGGVAHDFNNMLGVIIGHADLLLDEIDPDGPLFQDLEEIRSAAYHSADLTRQLLAFARKQRTNPRVLDLNDTISGMLKMLRRLITEDISLLWSPGPAPWKVKIDPSQIDQILANLLVNSRDAISGVGTITLKTENITLEDSDSQNTDNLMPGDYVLLTAGDTGAGMSKDVLKHIFEPFFTTKDVGRGTGLGLATVYGIVKQNNGFIMVDSRPNEGTTFRIYFPRFEPEREDAPEIESEPESCRGDETILLVEDDGFILNLTKRMLESLGYCVLAARSPTEAISLAEHSRSYIDLLVTDVVMPEMSGRELVDCLCAIRPGLRCLYMSGYTADVVAGRGIMDEGLHLLHKPFTKDVLAAKVKEVLKPD